MTKPIEEQLLDIARDRGWKDPRLHVVSKGSPLWRVVIDNYEYNFAQSGSDWADHNALYGNATIENGQVVRHNFQMEHKFLSERWSEGYNPDELVKELIKKVIETDVCSKCGSTNIVIWSRAFGWVKYACNDCGHKAEE